MTCVRCMEKYKLSSDSMRCDPIPPVDGCLDFALD